MKALIVAGIALALVVSAMCLRLVIREPNPRSADDAALVHLAQDSDSGAERWIALEERVRELAARVESLQDEIASLSTERHADPVATEERSAAPAPVENESSRSGPLWYLEQYERSFDEGGEGSEYFRLAVEAYARELLVPIEARVRNPSCPTAFRRSLIRMLGDGRFAKHGRVIDLLLGLIGSSSNVLIAEALAALAKIGDAGAARTLENLVWGIEGPDLQRAAIEIIVALSGGRANEAIWRLMRGASDDPMLAFLISQLSNAELVASLEAFQLASQESKLVRLVAARRVGDFRSADFEAFVDTWAAVETDPEVRAALGQAHAEQHSIASWSAAQAVGPPDAGADRDDPRAWASRSADMGEQWLELAYSPPMRANTLRVFEVNSPGAVSAVIGIDEQGSEHTLWSGSDPLQTPGVFEIAFSTTGFRVVRVRIALDTDRRSGWNEIDAVELVGPDGRAWASSATASSEYGH